MWLKPLHNIEYFCKTKVCNDKQTTDLQLQSPYHAHSHSHSHSLSFSHTHKLLYTHISIHHCCFCTWFLLLTGEERGSRERGVKEWSRNMCCGALGRTNPAMPVCLKMHWQTDKQTEEKQKQRSKLSTDTKRLFNERVFNYIVFGIDSNISISFHNTQ